MEYLIGASLALGVSVLASWVGFDRDRAFYPVVMIVIASYYDLYAVMGGSMQALATESMVTVVFVVVAILGFKHNLWIVAAALVAHGIFDFFHGHLVINPGVPAWWPMFCLTYDVVAGVCLSWLLYHSKFSAGPDF